MALAVACGHLSNFGCKKRCLRLQAEAALLAAKIGEMSASYGESHPKMIEARAQLKDLRAHIGAEVAKITSSNQNALVVATAKERQLRQELEWLKSQVAK